MSAFGPTRFRKHSTVLMATAATLVLGGGAVAAAACYPGDGDHDDHYGNGNGNGGAHCEQYPGCDNGHNGGGAPPPGNGGGHGGCQQQYNCPPPNNGGGYPPPNNGGGYPPPNNGCPQYCPPPNQGSSRAILAKVSHSQHSLAIAMNYGAPQCYMLPGQDTQVTLGPYPVGSTYQIRAFNGWQCDTGNQYNLHTNTLEAGQNPKPIDLTRN